jgi:hypothetical protein
VSVATYEPDFSSPFFQAKKISLPLFGSFSDSVDFACAQIPIKLVILCLGNKMKVNTFHQNGGSLEDDDAFESELLEVEQSFSELPSPQVSV